MPRWAEWIGKHQDLLFVGAVLAILLTVFVPMPPRVLDFLLVVSITVSVLTLLTVVYVREPLRFSVFPSVLLLTTAYRLALNVATTRQILANAGREGTRAAGDVIEAFGNFVAGAEPVIGFVIFAILVLVNFVVITKGATRISEVAARFTLDAMPGKQMAIDADLNAGLIDPAEARRRRTEVGREADFYGAMDGASKFVRGDAIAGIFITLINIVAGFAIGWMKYDMGAGEALYTFTILTVGDGLVSQVPALIVSIAAGLMVTRSAAEADLGKELLGQVFGHGKALTVAAVFLGVLLATGLPALPLVLVASLLGLTVWMLRRAARDGEARAAARPPFDPAQGRPAPAAPENVEGLLHVEPLELEVGFGLIRLADPAQGGTLLDRVTKLRRQMAVDLGLVVPALRVRDNMELPANDYAVKLRGVALARGTIRPDRLLAVESGPASGPLEGVPAKDPAFGLPAFWIAEAERARAEAAGYAVADAPSVLATHLSEVVKRHAHELLTREEVNGLIRNLKEKSPNLVDEVIPGVMKPGEVQKVLQNLLKEGVSIRDLGTILETIGDYAPRSKDPEILTEYARNALARTICQQHLERDGKMYVITLDPKLEDLVKAATERTDRGSFLGLSPALVRKIGERLGQEIRKLAEAGHPPVILCSPQVRAQVKKVADAAHPGVSVLSYNEILKDVPVEALGMVGVE